MFYQADPKFEIGATVTVVAVIFLSGFVAGRITAPEPPAPTAPKLERVSPFVPPPAENRDGYGFEGIAPRGGGVR